MTDDYQGIVDWLREMGEIDQAGEQREAPAYLAWFGWTPPPMLIPLPRRAPDELF